MDGADRKPAPAAVTYRSCPTSSRTWRQETVIDLYEDAEVNAQDIQEKAAGLTSTKTAFKRVRDYQRQDRAASQRVQCWRKFCCFCCGGMRSERKEQEQKQLLAD